MERSVIGWRGVGGRAASYPFGGSERAYGTPRRTHGSSWRFVGIPGLDARPALHLTAAHLERSRVRLGDERVGLGRVDRTISPP